MLRQKSLLVSLVVLVDRLPWPPEPAKRPRGRPKTYSDRLILKALVIMIIRRLYTAYALLTFLDQAEPWRNSCGHSLHAHGRFSDPPYLGASACGAPTTFARLDWRRGAASGACAHALGLPRTRRCSGQYAPETSGGVWHKKQGSRRVPHTSIDTERGGRSRGGHGGGTAGNCIWPCRFVLSDPPGR